MEEGTLLGRKGDACDLDLRLGLRFGLRWLLRWTGLVFLLFLGGAGGGIVDFAALVVDSVKMTYGAAGLVDEDVGCEVL
jgi:hypothetical protein